MRSARCAICTRRSTISRLGWVRPRLQEVHVAPDGEMVIYAGKGPIAFILGDPPFRKKIDQAFRVISELERRGSKPEAIMLNNEVSPDRVVARLK